MILNRLFRNTNFNWKYALGEILLIFIGISLSLAFEEWRTNRTNKVREIDLLHEMREAIQSDTAELSNQIRICKTLIKTSNHLENNLSTSKSLTDSIKYSLAWMNTIAGFNADYSAYQSIMAGGIVSISDTKLRREIISYYNEADRLKNWMDGLNKRRDQYITTLLMKEFEEFNREESAIPWDYEQLRKNREFMFYTRKSHELHRVTLIGLESHKLFAIEFLQKLADF
jgi:DNA repair ATPase RecN